MSWVYGEHIRVEKLRSNLGTHGPTIRDIFPAKNQIRGDLFILQMLISKLTLKKN
jgi:hypothetical protein